jgi:hypothetical protein
MGDMEGKHGVIMAFLVIEIMFIKPSDSSAERGEIAFPSRQTDRQNLLIVNFSTHASPVDHCHASSM